MSNELTTVDQAELKALAAELGAVSTQRNAHARVPLLKINRDVEDAKGRELPRGKFFLTGENPAYADTVTFRPLSDHFQYSRWDAEQKKFTCRSRQISDWKDEARDTCGTIRCGKPSGQDWESLSEAQKEKARAVKLTRLVRGLVSYTGTTLDGEEVTYDMQPCLLRLTGQNNFQTGGKRPIAPFEEHFKKRIPTGYEMWQFDLTLSAEKHRNDAGVIWYTFKYDFDPNAIIPTTVPVFESVKAVAELVRSENKLVDDAYMKAIRNNVDDAVYDVFGDDLDSDMEDVA